MQIGSIEDIAALRESEEIECKLAAGRDGRGELPNDLWKTFSAFANCSGGFIILGLRERNDKSFQVGGIEDVAKVKADFFSLANNPQKISACLVSDRDVKEIIIEQKTIIVIHVPQASRQHKPVYVDGNPMRGTYRRLHEGDCLCPPESVKRMLAEQMEDSRDDRILKGFGIEDLHQDSILVYRRALAASVPTHPFLESPLPEFLRNIRAWRRDRETGEDGITVAGLLMFGTSESIRDEFPLYALDYQERDEPAAGRWSDRLTTDGT